MNADFSFGPGSRYSYLAAMLLDPVSAETGARFTWRPVLSGDLTARTGGVPRSPQDAAWRTADVERWARHHGVPFHDVPAEVDGRRLALACAAAQALGKAEAFATGLYRQTCGGGRPPADDAALRAIAVAAASEQDAFDEALVARAGETYAENLQRALAAGAFGAPTWVTADGALFWGQDRIPLLVDHLKSLRAR